MHVDNSSSHSKLKVNMDISFPKIPCDILSLDVMDIMGNHQMNVGGNLKKQTFDKNGKIIKSDFHVKHRIYIKFTLITFAHS